MSNTATPLTLTLTVTAAAVASGLRAGGRAFVDMLGLVLVHPAVKSADAVESVIAEVKAALVAQHNEAAGNATPPQAAAPQGDKARGFMVQGYKTALNYASMLRKAEKAANGLDLIRAGFEGSMTVAQFADSLPSKAKAAAEAAPEADAKAAPEAAPEAAETINAAPAPDSIEVETDAEGTAIRLQYEGVSFIRESVLIATVADLNDTRTKLAEAQALIATLTAAKTARKARAKEKIPA